MKKRVKRAAIIAATMLLVWFPVAWLAELGHDPISGALSVHPIGTPCRMLKAILEFPLSWSGPDRPVNSAIAALIIYLAFWTPVFMLMIEGKTSLKKRKNKTIPNKTSELIR